jgi:hypothetical protein
MGREREGGKERERPVSALVLVSLALPTLFPLVLAEGTEGKCYGYLALLQPVRTILASHSLAEAQASGMV